MACGHHPLDVVNKGQWDPNQEQQAPRRMVNSARTPTAAEQKTLPSTADGASLLSSTCGFRSIEKLVSHLNLVRYRELPNGAARWVAEFDGREKRQLQLCTKQHPL